MATFRCCRKMFHGQRTLRFTHFSIWLFSTLCATFSAVELALSSSAWPRLCARYCPICCTWFPRAVQQLFADDVNWRPVLEPPILGLSLLKVASASAAGPPELASMVTMTSPAGESLWNLGTLYHSQTSRGYVWVGHTVVRRTLGPVDSTSRSLRFLGVSSTSGEVLWTTSFGTSKSKTLSCRLPW